MQLSVINLTGSTKTYLSGTVSVSGSSTLAITDNTKKLALATDGQLRFDLYSNFVQISDGINTFAANDAIDYLKLMINAIGPISDANGNALSSTLVSGQQALNVSIVNDVSPTNVSVVSTTNSSTTPLGSNAVFTGPWEEILNYADISVLVTTDQSSATDGLRLQYSTNAVNIDDEDKFTISANDTDTFTAGSASRYFRILYTNGSVAQSFFRLQTIYHINSPKPSSHRIDDSINGQNDAELVKAVLTGKNPDGSFNNERSQGTDSTNSTNTILAANATYRGSWFKWSDSFVSIVSIMTSDVAGTLYIDASNNPNPTNGTDTDVSYSSILSYDPTMASGRRITPVQSLWVRHRYVNGTAAQASFNLYAIYTISDSGLVSAPAGIVPTRDTLTGQIRAIQTIPNAAGTGYQDIPIDSATGNPKVVVTNLRDDVLVEALNGAAASQVVIGTTATRLDPSPVSDRRVINVTNEGPGRMAVGHSNTITFDSNSIRVPVGRSRTFGIDPTIQLYGICENTGGTQTVLTRSASTATGTATNPSNALTNNATYATMSANGQTITTSGYTAGTTNSLVQVRIGIDANKTAGTTETVAFQDVKTGNSAGSGTVSTSASVTAVTNHLYVAAISREVNVTVTGVAGIGLTWTKLTQADSDDSNRSVDIWYSLGTPSASGTVTASFTSTTTGAHISVSRYSNVSTTTPIQAFTTANGNSTTPATAGISGTAKGMAILATAIDNATTFTPGSGYTTASVDFAADSLAVMYKPLVSTATETPTSTINTAKHWSAISLTLTPAPAINPIVTLSYTLSAVAGATFGNLTFTSSTDATQYVDITSDKMWVVADVPNINIIATGQTISAAALNVDQVFLELTDTTGNSTRASVWQGGKAIS